MTQAQLDLQNQLEQTNNTDLTTQPLINDSTVLFRDAMENSSSILLNKLNIRLHQKNIKHLQKQIILNKLLEQLKQITMNNIMEHLHLRKSDMR